MDDELEEDGAVADIGESRLDSGSRVPFEQPVRISPMTARELILNMGF
jgi:hypothetical protein